MRVQILILGLLLTFSCLAANQTVQTASCGVTPNCFSGVTAHNINLALAAASCGDTVFVENYGVAASSASVTGVSETILSTYAKVCGSGSEVILRTPLDDSWLPDKTIGNHTLPSYAPLLATVKATAALGGNSIWSLQTTPPATGLKVIGFNTVLDTGYTVTQGTFPVGAYIGQANNFPTTVLTDWPNNITFDRTLWYGSSPTYSADISSLQSVFLLNVRDFNFVNSYIGGMNGLTPFNGAGGNSTSDTSQVRCGENCDNLVEKYNVFCCGFTENGLLTGGNPKQSYLSSPQGCRVSCDFEYNVMLNAIRYMPGESIGTGVHRPSIKNCPELKEGSNVTIQWNSCWNSWTNDFSQWFGVKLSHYTEDIPSSSFGAPTPTVSLSAGAAGAKSRLTFSGTIVSNPGFVIQRGGAVVALCILPVGTCSDVTYPNNGEWEYHTIATIVNPSLGSLTVDMNAGYTMVPATSGVQFMIASNPWTNANNLTVRYNHYRNVATMTEIDGGSNLDWCVTQGTCMSNVIFSNNMQIFDSNVASGFGGASIQSSLTKLTFGSQGLTMDHNGCYFGLGVPNLYGGSPPRLTSLYEFNSSPSGRVWNTFTFTNNFGCPSDVGGPSGANLAAGTATNLVDSNNSFIGTGAVSNGANQTVEAACTGGRSCTGNIWDCYQGQAGCSLFFYQNQAHFQFALQQNPFTVSNATNTSPINVTTSTSSNFAREQPLRITGVVGNTAANRAGNTCLTGTLDATHFPFCDEFSNSIAGNGAYVSGGAISWPPWHGSLTGSDVGPDLTMVALIDPITVTPSAYFATFTWGVPSGMSTLGCQMEVTTTAGLIDDSADYVVVNALRPDYFKRADSDASNPRASGSGTTSRTFQVGANTTVMGDDGMNHYIGLNPGSTYYYRIFCGGAMSRGSFTTTGIATSATLAGNGTKVGGKVTVGP